MRIDRSLLCVATLFAGAQLVNAADPCSLLTAAEAQQVIGSPISPGTPNKLNKAVCDYKINGGPSNFNVTLTAKGTADNAQRTVEALKKSKIAAEPVTGLGDSAYASSPGYGMQQIGVYKGASHVIVTVMMMGAPEAKAKAAAMDLARKALTHVQQ